MKRKILRGVVWAFTALFLFASPAEANVGVPFVFAGWLVMIPVLIPIILIEAAVLMRAGAHFWESHLAMSAANLASTLVGFVLAIAIDIVLGMTTSLYDLDDEDAPSNKWRVRVPVGGVFLLIPFFFLSWWIEAPLAIWIVDDLSAGAAFLAVRDGNIITYALLALLVGCLLSLMVWQVEKEESNNVRPNQSKATEEFWQSAYNGAGVGVRQDETISEDTDIVIHGASTEECPQKKLLEAEDQLQFDTVVEVQPGAETRSTGHIRQS